MLEIMLAIPITISAYFNRGIIARLPPIDTAGIILILASIIIIIPACEEIVFRHFLKDLGVYSTILFGFRHLLPAVLTKEWLPHLCNTINTMILGHFCMEQPTLSGSIVLHGVYNLLIILATMTFDFMDKTPDESQKFLKVDKELRFIKLTKRKRSKSVESNTFKELPYEYISKKDFYPPIKGLDYDTPFQNLPSLGLPENIPK